MTTAAVTNSFSVGNTIDPSEMNTNFQDLVDYLNTEVIVRDGSVAFTATPSGPASDPTTDNQFTRKKYVDDGLAGKSDTGHNHDASYYTKSQVDSALAGKSDTGHTHDFSALTGTVGSSQMPTNHVFGNSNQSQSYSPVLGLDWSDTGRIGIDMQFVTSVTTNTKTFIKAELHDSGSGSKVDAGTWRWTGSQPEITAGGSGVHLVGSVTTPSDRSLKNDILDLEVPIERLMRVQPCSFTMKSTGERKVGVIAQELQDVFPLLVSEREDGLLQVDYVGLSVMLLAAVQDLARHVVG